MIPGISDCDHVGAIYTITHSDPDTGADYGGNVTYQITGAADAPLRFTIFGNQVRTTSSLRLNCNTNYRLRIQAIDNAGKYTSYR